MAERKKWLWRFFQLLLIIAMIWGSLASRSPLDNVVSRPVDTVVMFVILAAAFYLLPFLSFRYKVRLIVLVILGCVPLFYFATAIAFHYMSFIFLLVLFTAASLWPNQIQAHLSPKESFRYVWSMLRNEPSPREVQMLAAIRADRKLSKP